MSTNGHIYWATAAETGAVLVAYFLLLAGALCFAFYADVRARVWRGLCWFGFHAARGLALMAVSTYAFLLLALDWARHRKHARHHRYARQRLSRAEKDSRRCLGVPLGHPERVAVGELDKALSALQDRLWPHGDWVEVIEAEQRERGEQA